MIGRGDVSGVDGGARGRVRYACEYDSSGYAVAARRCLLALHDAGEDVRWQPLVNVPGGRLPAPLPADAPPDLAALYAEPVDEEVLIAHSVPQAWGRLRRQFAPTRMIGHTVWEADRLPTLWLSEMDMVDEFWVPTEWNRQIFSDAFHRPVHVVPHACALDSPEPPPLHLPDHFFVVAIVSAWDWRKRPDVAIECFLRAFKPDDPVCLVIKTTRMPVAWPQRQRIPTAAHVGEILARWPSRPYVLLDTADWPEEQVLGLLRRSDCFLSTTASEGWGLGAFDAACLGTPVLITGHGGQLEWLGVDYPGLLPFRIVEATHPDSTLFEPGMRWGEVDADSVVEALRALQDGRAPQLAAAAASLAAILRNRYSAREVGLIARAALNHVA